MFFAQGNVFRNEGTKRATGDIKRIFRASVILLKGSPPPSPRPFRFCPFKIRGKSFTRFRIAYSAALYEATRGAIISEALQISP